MDKFPDIILFLWFTAQITLIFRKLSIILDSYIMLDQAKMLVFNTVVASDGKL